MAQPKRIENGEVKRIKDGFNISAHHRAYLWCNFLGTRYNIKDVAIINHPNILNTSGYFAKSAYNTNPAAGIIRTVISK